MQKTAIEFFVLSFDCKLLGNLWELFLSERLAKIIIEEYFFYTM